MSTIHRSRTIVSAFAATFMVALTAPITVHAQDQVLTEEQALAPASVPGPSVSVEDSRVSAAQHALLSPDLGSMQEEALMAVVAAAMSWDETSGYGSVEASRAANALPIMPATSTNQVPSDVRWAPARVISPGPSIEEARVFAAQHGLQSRDLGSMQEEALFAIVAAAPSWDETSGYGVLEASRATIGHPAFTTTETSRLAIAQQALLSGDLGSMQEEALTIAVARGTASDAPRISYDLSTRLERGTRAESPVLWSILHPEERAVMANSDDRIANALFGDQSNGDAAVEASGAEMAEYEVSVAGTPDEAALLAQFRAVELSSSRYLGADQHLSSGAAAS